MQCPRCESNELIAHELDGVQVDACTECGGFFLDDGELKELMAAARDRIPEEILDEVKPFAVEKVRPDRAHKIACPGCGAGMLETNYSYTSNVLIDVCPSCGGIWLDAGEILHLRAFAESKERFMNEHGRAFQSFASEKGKSLTKKYDILDGQYDRMRLGTRGFGPRRRHGRGLLGVLAAMLRNRN